MASSTRTCSKARALVSAFEMATLALAAVVPLNNAMAQQDVLTLPVSVAPTWDANVFRAPGGVTDPQQGRGLSGRSDLYTTTSVGLDLNKSYAQQNFRLTLGQTATRYDKFKFLDRDATNYRGALQWYLTPRISGSLSTDRSESIIGFEDSRAQGATVTATRNHNLTIDVWLFSGWHLLASVGKVERRNSAVFLALPSSDLSSGDFGVRYESPGWGSISFIERRSRGINTGQQVDRTNFIDSGFETRESEARLAWTISGKSSLSGRVTRTQRRHDNIPERDFSGTSLDAAYTWNPTAKLGLALTATRAVAPFTTGTSSSFRVDETLALAPSWRLTEKVTLIGRVARLSTTYDGPVVATTAAARRDTLHSMRLGANWQVHGNAVIAATLDRDRRESTDPTLSFNNLTAGLRASFTF